MRLEQLTRGWQNAIHGVTYPSREWSLSEPSCWSIHETWLPGLVSFDEPVNCSEMLSAGVLPSERLHLLQLWEDAAPLLPAAH